MARSRREFLAKGSMGLVAAAMVAEGCGAGRCRSRPGRRFLVRRGRRGRLGLRR